MPTPQEIRDDVDLRLAALRPTLVARQATYLGLRRRYFQGLRTHDAIPADGIDSAPDQLAGAPTDQAEDWNAFGLSPGASVPYALVLDVYQGRDGHGFVASVLVRILGRLWRRRQNFGPETYRDRAWEQLP